METRCKTLALSTQIWLVNKTKFREYLRHKANCRRIFIELIIYRQLTLSSMRTTICWRPLGWWGPRLGLLSLSVNPALQIEMQSLHLVLGRRLGCFTVRVASRTCLANLSSDILATWRTVVAEISRFGGEISRHSMMYEFHSCALCHEVSHHELYAKIPSLPLAL